MKNSYVVLAVTLLAGIACAEPKIIEDKGRITDLDPVIGAIYIQTPAGVKLYQAKDELLVRQGLVRKAYSDLQVGDLVEVQHWDDKDAAERVDIVEKVPVGTAIAQQTTSSDVTR